MRKFVLSILFIAAVVGSIIYFILNVDTNITVSKVTYINFTIDEINFDFAVRDDDTIKLYSPKDNNSDNLTIDDFKDKGLVDGLEIIFNNKKFNAERVDVKVITKNPETKEYYFNIIEDKLKEYNLKSNLVNPTFNDLVQNSNEVSYDEKQSITNENIELIVKDLYEKIYTYVDDKMQGIEVDINKLENTTELYDYDLVGYTYNDFDIQIMDNSSYSIEFKEDNTFVITLNLVMEYKYQRDKYHIIDEYNLTYNGNTLGEIKINYYKY